MTNEKEAVARLDPYRFAALRFLYNVTIERDWALEEVLPLPKKPQKHRQGALENLDVDLGLLGNGEGVSSAPAECSFQGAGW
ncbi:hypothetical protein HB778_40190 (plasmid) [Mesorhizobium huakuii]|uniref:Uncharacterized protein n=1 Tax=Mesorhizobium huakuii TaxID=28104 RepID=A0A7G6T5B8_9HYPH|nr:hypothetical protein HB778_40190 [Mesorhizobium huakuii]